MNETLGKVLAQVLNINENDLEGSRSKLDELSDCPDPLTVEGAAAIVYGPEWDKMKKNGGVENDLGRGISRGGFSPGKGKS